LNDSVDIGTMSCEFGTEGLKAHKEGFEIGKHGMKDLSTG
jgi:hypothetical protein